MGGNGPCVVIERPVSERGSSAPLAALARARDWAPTPLGPVEDWPAALRHAALLCLAAPDPAVIWWGGDFSQIYNEAAIPLYGPAHPAALGRVARAAPPTGWDTLRPLVAGVFATGSAATFEMQPCSVAGPTGPEDRHLSGSLLPIRSEAGEVGGVLGMLRDTTARVAGEDRLRERATALAALDEAKTAFFVDLSQALIAPLSLMQIGRAHV